MKLEKFFDKIVIINLKRRRDRWEECLHEMQWNSIPQEKVLRFEAFDNSQNGHQGCTRSHRELIKQIADGQHGNRVLVLEDDFAVIHMELIKAGGWKPDGDVWKTFCKVLDGGGNMNDRFNFESQFVPENWDVLYLGASYGEPPISRVNKYVIRCGFMQTTSSYGITREFAKVWTDKVGHDLETNPGPIDNVFGGMSHDHNYYVFQPRLTFQRMSKSDLDGQTNSRLGAMTDPVHENMV